MGAMFGNVEDYGEMFQDISVETRGASLSTRNQIGNPVLYKLVRVAKDGRLVPATDEEILEVEDLLENKENDMPILPDPGQTEGYIPDEGSPSQFLRLESLEGLFQSETAEAYTEKLISPLEFKEELFHGFTLPDTKFQSSNELYGNEEQFLSEFLLQEPICYSSNGCSMNQSMDVSPYSNATCSPKEASLSTAASKPDSFGVSGDMSLDNLSIKELQETFRATFGRETTVKDKQWLKGRITMGLINSCGVITTSPTIVDNKLVGGGQDNYNDSKNTVDEERRASCKDTPSSPDCIKEHSNDCVNSPVETFVDHYSGNEDFEGEHRPVKRARKPTRRFIEEISKTDEKQQSEESVIPSKDQKSSQAISSGGRVVVTRMVSLAGSRIQVPYVSHVRRSRPRENMTALGDFPSIPWEMDAMPEESDLNLVPSLLNNDLNRVSGVKSASGPAKKEDDKDHLNLILTEVDQDMMEPEHLDSSGDSSDDSVDNNNHVGLRITQNAFRRKHHRSWTLSEVKKLVEGVSKYGVGKWSVIKRLSFPSYSHRSPVDIKDKWRNLLRASFAHTHSDRMGSLKKHGSMAIPSQIMLQVRELAQKKSLVSLVSKTRMVKKSRNRFL
ncbi:unnamed protein product [Arabis nemorensis]|uniref:Uncharacterized protein n=1 Tax=Arabis nemorensis TaxID=586526 RepID=A0A565AQH2_9BRAS|nr:unnamed protein product [Arabis nemorensis]